MNKTLRWLSLWAGLLLSLLVLGAFAQENDGFDTLLFEIEGVYSVDKEGVITVDGVVLAPAATFVPPQIANGTRVKVIGILLGDDTLQVVSIEEVLDEEDEADAEVTPEPQPEATPEAEVTPEPQPEATPEASAGGRVCVPNTHPVANAIANEFEVTVEEVIALHCAGEGFGNIARAYMLARALDGDVNAILAQRGGKSWRDLLAEANLRPQDLAPGYAMSNRPTREGDEKRGGGRPPQAGGGNPNAGGNQGGGGRPPQVGSGNPNASGNQGGGGRPPQVGGGNPNAGGNQGGGGRPPQGGGRP